MSTYIPTMPPVNTVAPDASNAPGGRGRVFAFIFGVVAILVTLGAIVLAVIAPMLSAAPPAPGTWTKDFDADLNSQTSIVSTGPQCQLGANGLDVVGERNAPATCDVTLSGSASLANGFLLTVRLAPDAQLSGAEQPYIWLGQSAFVAVEQVSTDSTFAVCTAACGTDATNEQDIGSDAWHNDNYHANTLTLYWPGSGQQLVVYANGQEVTSIAFAFDGTPSLALGALERGEALYTHLTLYTP